MRPVQPWSPTIGEKTPSLKSQPTRQVLVLHLLIDVPRITRPGEVVGVDVADDFATAQPRAHVARVAEAEELRVIIAIIDDPSAGEMLAELALDPARHVIGRAVVEQDELKAGMIGVPGEILRQGLLEVMKPSHADGKK